MGKVRAEISVVHCSKDIIDFGINLNPGWRIVPRLLEQCQDFESMNELADEMYLCK